MRLDHDRDKLRNEGVGMETGAGATTYDLARTNGKEATSEIVKKCRTITNYYQNERKPKHKLKEHTLNLSWFLLSWSLS